VLSAGRRRAALVMAIMAACAVAEVASASALTGSSSVLGWTKQAPAATPPGLFVTKMAYDAATGSVVMFGGVNPSNSIVDGGTWTWR